MNTKTCTKCGEEKPATTDYFTKCSRSSDGLTARCKVCRRSQTKAYREANKEKIAAYNKAYREANKEERLAYQKAYRQANKEKIRADAKTWRENNKEKLAAYKKAYREANKEALREYYKVWRENNKEKKAAQDKRYREANKEHVKSVKEKYYTTPQGKFSRIKVGAKQRGLLFELDYEYYEKNLWGKPCHYCKTEVPSSGTQAIGLDRKDSNGGYTHENVVPCCWSCNTKKQDIPYDEYMNKLAG